MTRGNWGGLRVSGRVGGAPAKGFDGVHRHGEVMGVRLSPLLSLSGKFIPGLKIFFVGKVFL